MGICTLCGSESKLISSFVGLCLRCIREKPEDALEIGREAHTCSRRKFALKGGEPPKDGLKCPFCGNGCEITPNSLGFCGLVRNVNGKLPREKELLASYYYDPLPTNCVSSWCCAGTGIGHPYYSYTPGMEYGYYNLAVFCIGCSFDCLFCQNWNFRTQLSAPPKLTENEFINSILPRTSCVCFFGGDPSPQLDKIIKVCERVREVKKQKILRFCLETNGNSNSVFIKRFAKISSQSGGCIKFDLKFWDENVNRMICGTSNKNSYKNFQLLEEFHKERKKPPLLTASTLMVPGYVDDEEIKNITKFVAEIDENIPYSLLAYYPHFEMKDLPLTQLKDAQRYVKIAKESGLKNVRIGNTHLLV